MIIFLVKLSIPRLQRLNPSLEFIVSGPVVFKNLDRLKLLKFGKILQTALLVEKPPFRRGAGHDGTERESGRQDVEP
jgi:hypothetical protein